MPFPPDAAPRGLDAPRSTGETLVLLVGLPLLAALCWIMAGILSAGDGGSNAALPAVDFSVFWSAGRLANRGLAAQAYDLPAFAAAISADLGRDLPVGGLSWLNPPVFYLLVAPFAALPLRWAWAIWIAASVVLAAIALRVVLPRWSVVVGVLLAPGAIVTVALGQNALLTASLLSLTLAWIDRRPVAAGICLGLVAYKPQFGVLYPVLLAATGRWVAFACAAATVVALCAASALLFGPQAWWDFLGSLGATRDRMDVTNDWIFKFQSIFMTARRLGAGPGIAWAAHLAVAAAATILVARLWRRQAPGTEEAQAAAALAATLLVTPYVLPYDAVILAMACVFLFRASLREGPMPWELPIGMGACIATGAPLVLDTTGAGWLAALAVLALALRRAAAGGFPRTVIRP